MLLARAAAREKEMAIRTSIGASRWLLIRQLLVESLMLAVAGAMLGCLFAYAGIKGVVNLMPQGLFPTEADIRLSIPVLLFSLVVAVVTALLFGLVPALQTAKKNMADPLKDSGRGIVGGFRRGKLRSALVISEVALSLVLLAGAGLLMRNFIGLQTIDLGFDPNNILVARLPLPRGQSLMQPRSSGSSRRCSSGCMRFPAWWLRQRQRACPHTAASAQKSTSPARRTRNGRDAIFQLCSEGYFPTLGLKLLRGRILSSVDVRTARKVAVVNQALVSKYFGNEDPRGRQIRLKMLESFPTGMRSPIRCSKSSA